MDNAGSRNPLKHPLHPALVHFPIGLFALSLLLDILRAAMGESAVLSAGAYYAMLGGVAAAIAAALAGFADWVDIRADHPAKRTATIHMTLNLGAVALYGFDLWWRATGGGFGIAAGLSAAAFGLILISGYLGGAMVYADGIAVGRHRRPTPTPRETLSVSSSAPAEEYVEIPEASELKDGETLRAEIDGTIVTLARWEGRYFAVQEFCTHRLGPLSEGRIAEGQVMCPWHRSCFDLASGKVTQGPAKMDLKTYEIKMQDGRILIRIPREEQPKEQQRAA